MSEIPVVPLGLYIHIPFCRKKCPYCSFYSEDYNEALASDYVDVLARQIEGVRGGVSSIYIGGGTPTVLRQSSIERLLQSLKRFASKGIEFSVEANPESVIGDKLKLFLDGGVNRISVGLQSFSASKLTRLGRIHTVRQGIKAVDISLKAGFDNINIDLMFGIGNETLIEWESDLEKAVKLPIRHISCYGLTYEENTVLFSARDRGDISVLDEETVTAMYSLALDYLPSNGFEQYEVSNFAAKGYSCGHNLNYWKNDSSLGFGPGAVSYVEGIRKANVPDVIDYIRKAKERRDFTASSEKLSCLGMAKETASVKIRTTEGIDFNWFKEKTGFDFLELEKDVLTSLTEKGLLEYKKQAGLNSGIRLTRRGFLFCDTVSSELL